jgi:hypothetical protein
MTLWPFHTVTVSGVTNTPLKACLLSRGQILGRNPEKSLQSFPPPVASTALLEILISSNSRNLLKFQKRRKDETDRKPIHLPYGLRNPYRNLKSENSLT